MAKRLGFTLAEVLVTMTIIGFLAILITTVVNNVTASTNIKSWRKVYSDLMNAQQRMIGENGSVADSFDDITSDAQGGINLQTGWLNYMSYTKTCAPGQSVNQKCWYPSINYYDNSNTWPGQSNGFSVSAVLNNGMILLFYPGTTGDFTGMDPAQTSSDMYVFIDVNGLKAPNTFGKDVFCINYSPKKGKFVAYGEGYDVNCNVRGFNCSAYYLLNDQ